MKIIKVTSGDPKLSQLLLRQTPGGQCIWGDCKFIVNQPLEQCDWWFVLHSSSVRNTETTICDPNKVVYISMEPTESVLGTKRGFLDQFATLVLTDRSIDHPKKIYACGHTWWVGFAMRYGPQGHVFDPEVRLNYDTLKNLKPLEKKDRISIVVSNKQFLPGHRARLEFLQTIRQHPVAKYIDLYGGGFNPIDDKWDVISNYKYHIALENTVLDDYWTEKLADPLLGECLTFYFGCPNIDSYFGSDAIAPINITKPIEAADEMLAFVEANEFQNRGGVIRSAKDLVLDRYNIFNIMATVAGHAAPPSKSEQVTLNPNGAFKL